MLWDDTFIVGWSESSMSKYSISSIVPSYGDSNHDCGDGGGGGGETLFGGYVGGGGVKNWTVGAIEPYIMRWVTIMCCIYHAYSEERKEKIELK